MAKIQIEGVPQYNGEWPLDFDVLTNRDFHTIKQIAGVRVNEIDGALDAGDLDIVVALAVIALRKAGHEKVNADVLWDSPVGKITLVDDDTDEEEGAGPVPLVLKPLEQSGEKPDSNDTSRTASG